MPTFFRFLIPVALILSQAGCWLSYSWKDYEPFVSIRVEATSRSYSGTFKPIHSGAHVLALRIDRHWPSDVRIDLKIAGTLMIEYADGTKQRFPVKREFHGNYTTPPTPFDFPLLYFKVARQDYTFDQARDCRVMFNLEIQGDVDGLLQREPDWWVVARFDETE